MDEVQASIATTMVDVYNRAGTNCTSVSLARVFGEEDGRRYGMDTPAGVMMRMRKMAGVGSNTLARIRIDWIDEED